MVVVGDSCGSAVALAFDAGVATATGSTVGLTDDASAFYPSCAGAAGPDAVYTFTTTAPRQLTARVSTSTATYEPILYVRSVCTGGNELVCGHAPGPGRAANVFVSSLPAGYALFVDGLTGTSGAFQLDVTLGAVSSTAPANDLCAGAIVLPAGPIQFAGTTLNATDDQGGGTFSSTCRTNGSLTRTPAGTPGLDVIYDWTATATRLWTVTMEPVPGWDAAPWVTVAPTCGGDGGACVAGADNAGSGPPGTERFTINATAGTHYFIVIDGYDVGGSGDFTLSIR